MKPTALAWKNLTADWRRLALGAAGVAFAAILMFMQNGFRNALLDSPVQLLALMKADLVAVSVARFSLATDQTFARTDFDRALADADVTDGLPVYVERLKAQVRVAGEPRRPIRVVALPLRPGWFLDAEIETKLEQLIQPESALLDRRTRSTYGFDLEHPQALQRQSVELLNQSLHVVDTISIGTDFANDGTLLMSDRSFAQYFGNRARGEPTSEIDFALFRLRPGANLDQAAKRLTELNPRGWKVEPRDEVIRREIRFWNEQTPIGMIFFIGSMMGFAVGIIICYQILFNSINDSLPEFATLKAMGYSNAFFVWLVIKQSLYLAWIGFLPALLISGILFEWIQWSVGLPMLLSIPRIVSVLALTTIMCLISGLLALRKLLSADPASLF